MYFQLCPAALPGYVVSCLVFVVAAIDVFFVVDVVVVFVDKDGDD